MHTIAPQPQNRIARIGEVFAAFLALGLTSFGGPIAHLGFFREAFVTRRKWLTDAAYAEIVALCQFLPGPASSQVGITIGLLRAGLPGAFAAWIAFTLPSAILLVAFALGLGAISDAIGTGPLHALKIAALAVVVQALWSMAKTLTPDRFRMLIALATAAILLVVPIGLMQITALLIAGCLGAIWLAKSAPESTPPLPQLLSWPLAITCLVTFAALLVALPVLAHLTADPVISLADKMMRSGSLVFGGGHVVLPLLKAEFVTPGLIQHDVFLAGYGAAQAVPGPLFAFAAYVGASLPAVPNQILGATVALCAIYVPSFLLVFGALPFWSLLGHSSRARGALAGANAAVVGLLLAAAYDPVFTSAVTRPTDFAFALVVFAALQLFRLPPWLVVFGAAMAGYVLQPLGF